MNIQKITFLENGLACSGIVLAIISDGAAGV